jgi:hypothetical protein
MTHADYMDKDLRAKALDMNLQVNTLLKRLDFMMEKFSVGGVFQKRTAPPNVRILPNSTPQSRILWIWIQVLNLEAAVMHGSQNLWDPKLES